MSEPKYLSGKILEDRLTRQEEFDLHRARKADTIQASTWDETFLMPPRLHHHRKALREAIRSLPYTEVCELVAVHMSERSDHDLESLTKLQKEIMNIAWPLIGKEDET